MSYLPAHRAAATRSPQPTGWLYGDRLRAGRRQALRRRRARLARRVAEAALCRQAGHARAAVPFGRRAADARRHRRRARLPDRDPRHRRCRQCAGHLASTSSCRRNIRGDRRWRIEHFQIVDPADIPRLAPAGIIASMQPTHQTSDRLMAEKRLGPNRLAGRLCLADGAEERRATGVRHRLPGRIAQPVPRPRRRRSAGRT